MLKYTLPFMLLLSLAFSINASYFSDYLYLNESNATIYIMNVTDNGDLYELAYINAKPVLLFYNEELVSKDIRDKFTTMSNVGFMMKQSDRQKVIDYLLLYNISRNNGQKWPGKEEYACRQSLAFHVKDCYDTNSCLESAKLVCAAYSTAIGCNDVNMVLSEVTKFGIGSHQTDAIINEVISKISSLDITNVNEILKNVSSLLSKLDKYRKDIESSKFRYPAQGEICNDCYAICPDLVLNETNIYEAQKIVNAAIEISTPISDFEGAVALLEDETSSRIAYSQTTAYLREVKQDYLNMKERKQNISLTVNKTLAIVNDIKLARTLKSLSTLENEIEDKIDARNTTALKNDLEEYKRLLNVLNITLNEDLILYNQTLSAKDEANSALFMLRGMKPESVDKYAENVTMLDNTFSTGLEPSELSELYKRYSEINGLMKEELDKAGKGNVSIQTKALLNNLKQLTAPLGYAERENIKNNLHFYIVLSILTTLFFALFISSLLLSYTSQNWARISAIAIIIIALVIPIIALTAEEGAKNINIENVFDRIDEFENVNIVESPQSYRVEIKMDACAEKVKEVLEAKGKKVNVYKLSSGNCYKNGLALAECLQNSEGFYLNFNEGIPKVSYFLFYKDEINIYGQEDDFKICAIARLVE